MVAIACLKANDEAGNLAKAARLDEAPTTLFSRSVGAAGS